MPRHGGTNRMFIDEVVIHVRGGSGGHGCVSFRREKYVPKGGPDGGDGGHGGSVYLIADDSLSTLLELAGRHHWHASNGQPGMGSNRHGKRGTSLAVRVPPGTLIYDADSGRLLKDLVDPHDQVIIARGGRGGRGNAHYVTSTNQAPREAAPGKPGQERKLRLELKLIADVGLVGLPNAGKSTLLSRLTRARPKIAAYPFTTLEPQLGILDLPGFRRIVLADIPGLIEGAHEGVGLGDAFLKHVERNRAIVHLIDLMPADGNPTPIEAYHIIRRELEEYRPELAQRPEIIVGNKLDLTGASEQLTTLRGQLEQKVYGISGVVGTGLRELGEALWEVVDQTRTVEAEKPKDLPRIDLGDVFDVPTGPRDTRPPRDDLPKSLTPTVARDLNAALDFGADAPADTALNQPSDDPTAHDADSVKPQVVDEDDDNFAPLDGQDVFEDGAGAADSQIDAASGERDDT